MAQGDVIQHGPVGPFFWGPLNADTYYYRGSRVVYPYAVGAL